MSHGLQHACALKLAHCAVSPPPNPTSFERMQEFSAKEDQFSSLHAESVASLMDTLGKEALKLPGVLSKFAIATSQLKMQMADEARELKRNYEDKRCLVAEREKDGLHVPSDAKDVEAMRGKVLEKTLNIDKIDTEVNDLVCLIEDTEDAICKLAGTDYGLPLRRALESTASKIGTLPTLAAVINERLVANLLASPTHDSAGDTCESMATGATVADNGEMLLGHAQKPAAEAMDLPAPAPTPSKTWFGSFRWFKGQ